MKKIIQDNVIEYDLGVELWETFFQVVIHDLNPKYQEEHSHMKIWGRGIPGRENSKHKCPKAGLVLVILSKRGSVAWAEKEVGREAEGTNIAWRPVVPEHFKNSDNLFRFHI